MQRHRFLDGMTRYTKNLVCSQSYLACDPSWVTAATRDQLATGTYRQMDDTVVPGFHKRIEAGEVFFNALSSRMDSYQETGTGWMIEASSTHLCGSNPVRTQTKWDGPIITQSLGSPNLVTGGIDGRDICDVRDIDRLSIELSTSVLSKRGRSSNNSFETLAELGKTCDQLLGKFRQISSVLGSMNYRRTSSREKISGISNEYLGYRYGISPLLNDVEGIIKGMGAKQKKVRQTTRASGFIEARTQSVFDLGFGVGTVRTSCLHQGHDRVEIRAMSLDEYVADLSFNTGFSAKGLITLPWELVPYSFVADWFLNIGDMFGAMVPTPSFTQLGSCLVIRRNVVNTWTAQSSVAATGYNLLRPTSGVFVNTRKTVVRQPLSLPGLVIKSDFRFDKLTRVADAAALVAQKFMRLK